MLMVLFTDEDPLVDQHADNLFDKERISLCSCQNRLTQNFGKVVCVEQNVNELAAFLPRKRFQFDNSKVAPSAAPSLFCAQRSRDEQDRGTESGLR